MKAYKKDFDAIVKTYNDAAEEAQGKNGQPPDSAVVATFKTKRKDLVLATRKDIHDALSPAGASQFHGYAQAQKRSMTVTLEEDFKNQRGWGVHNQLPRTLGWFPQPI
jgi:hypothetical protein